MECVGHDADNRVRFPVNGDLPAHGSTISGVTTLPKRVADNGHALVSRHVFAPFEQSAGGRLDSEDAEQSIGDLKSGHRFGVAIAGKRHRRKAVCGHVFKCAIRGGPVLEVRKRHPITPPAAPEAALPKLNEPVWLLIVELAYEYRVNDAEHEGIGANNDSQRQDDAGGEPSIFCEEPGAVTHVLPEVREQLHGSPHGELCIPVSKVQDTPTIWK